MLEIKNKKNFPVQLIVRSRETPKSFTTLNIPGLGSGKNICYLDEERSTEYIDKFEGQGLISVKIISNKPRKGE